MMQPIIELIQTQLQTELEGQILRAVQKVGVSVDKDRLLKALTDAKAFYDEGYKDGYKDGYRAAVWESIAQCEGDIE